MWRIYLRKYNKIVKVAIEQVWKIKLQMNQKIALVIIVQSVQLIQKWSMNQKENDKPKAKSAGKNGKICPKQEPDPNPPSLRRKEHQTCNKEFKNSNTKMKN